MIARMKWFVSTVAVALVICVPRSDAAEPATPDECKDKEAARLVKCLSPDFSLPDSPGLMIIGLGTDDVVRPTTPRALGAALMEGIDADGDPKRGFALDLAPYKLLRPGTTRKDYVDSWQVRALWNTQFSAGVGKGTDADDKSLSLGYGVSSVLWRPRGTDPLRGRPGGSSPADVFQDCIDTRLKAITSISVMPSIGSSTGQDNELAKCYSDFAAKTWHVTALTVGFAGSELSGDGKWSGLESSTSGLWATFSYAFDNVPVRWLRERSELLLAWRDLNDELVADPANAGSFLEQDSEAVSLLFRLHAGNRNVHIQYSRQREKRPGESETTKRLAAGLEWRLAEGVWLVATLGEDRNHSSTNGDSFFRTGLKLGIGETPSFARN